MKIKIDKGIIPIPLRGSSRSHHSMYPYNDLQKKQSFSFITKGKAEARKKAKYLASYLWNLQKSNIISNKKVFTTRVIGNLIRVWRIK